jgi:hypothetical protein
MWIEQEVDEYKAKVLLQTLVGIYSRGTQLMLYKYKQSSITMSQTLSSYSLKGLGYIIMSHRGWIMWEYGKEKRKNKASES